VLLPSDQPELYLLRPLTGTTDDYVAVHRRLADVISFQLPEERLQSATFPEPTVEDLADAASARLLWQAARLTLREGATPFRSLGRISIRPRIYQFVPLLMSLRLDPVRILIADDVGVGKTIEALLIARELYDRGEIKRLCVLCPPYLCEQWQRELSEKFNMDAVVIRSGTVGQLERRKTSQESIYRYYPIQVASIDFLKSDRNKHLFLLDCPELVIVDEAHGAATPADRNRAQHQRYELVKEIAQKEDRHLILLTATPHSGVDASFRCLLSLLRPHFAEWDTSNLTEQQRTELAKHFVQRTRRDILRDWEGEPCFPQRESEDVTYRLSPDYRRLFDATYNFCSEIVRSGRELDERRRRVRYWGALALLRCVMSSPAAAVAALESRQLTLETEDGEPDYKPFVFESSEDLTDDGQPTPPVEATEATLSTSDRRRLRELATLAEALRHSHQDTKLTGCVEVVKRLLRERFHPIVWCRYIATADYLAQRLEEALRPLFPDIRVVSITGQMGDEERRAKVDELGKEPCRVLVATDCLSEGINLQQAFNAVIHYDLPWNPNRLEQREGRVDRYGQTSKRVKAIRYFSPDSPVDGVVLDVLLNKAREIHRTLGIYVPVPEEGESVTEALLNALFLRQSGARTEGGRQLTLDFGDDFVASFHRQWEIDAERERTNRTRFAQRVIKVDEVRKELEATDAVLGDPDAVREFVLSAAQRISLQITPDRKRSNVFRIAVGPEASRTLPPAVSSVLPTPKTGHWVVSFTSPTPEGAEYIGRNHRFVAALARFLMEEALTKGGRATAARCGVITTRAVSRLSTILLLRVRYLVDQPNLPTLLSEEILVAGFTEGPANGQREWLTEAEALQLLAAQPDVNLSLSEKRELIRSALAAWPSLQGDLQRRIEARAAELKDSHKRVRQVVSMRVGRLTVTPQLPPDLLGILVLQPVVES
jgi:superfamily II DNA or RNA helicase